jgi:hypothetical protein
VVGGAPQASGPGAQATAALRTAIAATDPVTNRVNFIERDS